MLGIIVQLAISWIIIWFFEKGNLSFLGLRPTKKRMIDFFLFLLVTAACCASGFLLRMILAKEQWQINPVFNTKLLFEGIWWNIKSVMYEELIFRGVLFYILIKKLGFVKAIVLSAIAFGIYHWFSFEVFGDIKEMAVVFLFTGVMGLLYAYGYAKTFSLYIPIAIHFGWNFTRRFVFSDGPIGDGIFIPVKSQPGVTVSYFTFYLIWYFPIVSALLINFFLLKRKKQVPVPNG